MHRVAGGEMKLIRENQRGLAGVVAILALVAVFSFAFLTVRYFLNSNERFKKNENPAASQSTQAPSSQAQTAEQTLPTDGPQDDQAREAGKASDTKATTSPQEPAKN